MAKKKYSLDKDSLYQKIMPTGAAAENAATLGQSPSPAPSNVSVIPTTVSPAQMAAANLTDPEPALPEKESPIAPERPFSTETMLAQSSRKPTPLQHTLFPLPVNLVEKVILASIRSSLKMASSCTCPRCQFDAAAVALNKVAPKYLSPFSSQTALSDFYYNQHFAEILSATSSACDAVKRHPRHQEDVDIQSLYLFNLMELLVYDKIISSFSNMDSDYCQCAHCLSDVAACMLNALPPRYVVTHEGILFAKLGYMRDQYAVDLTIQYLNASKLVHEHPRH